MLTAMIAACGLWGVSWCLGDRLASAWGVLLPCALMPLLALIDLDMMQLRSLIVIAMLATLVMLFNSRLRHYLLLPSCMALAGGLAAVSLNFSFGENAGNGKTTLRRVVHQCVGIFSKGLSERSSIGAKRGT